ncbi:hypothetical protein N8E88_12135 (plasmid) [Phyllobacterium zundukense]|uniref:Uncharacterized protein n=3 Tax=Phyllobacterium zundukense TaxID=1867719 RepID=A0ACD4CWQ0_9HYPH|nr:hypothetical protein N8E88_06140 [Phyllobacterium zundukense]UXN58713.1 hypothetical protein N8E88_12135 [Phyllobacterium zundukense]
MSENEKADHFKTNRMLPAHSSVAHPDRTIITREALSDARMNTFTRDGSLRGLDGFIDEYGKLSEQEPGEAELLVSATPPKI